MRAFLSAIQFLTIIPVPLVSCKDDRKKAVWFFPVVGLLIGLIAAYLDSALVFLLPTAVASVLVIIFFIVISGALHLDGLADTADGFFSCRPRERMLEIMRDSRSGPMGIVAVVSVLLLKYSVVFSLADEFRWHALLLMPVAGRSSVVIVMGLLSYLRTDGLGSGFQSSIFHSIWAGVFLLATGYLLSSWPGFLGAGVSVLVTLAFAGYCYRKIQGYTGDTLGAVCEIVEIVPAITWIVCVQRGWESF